MNEPASPDSVLSDAPPPSPSNDGEEKFETRYELEPALEIQENAHRDRTESNGRVVADGPAHSDDEGLPEPPTTATPQTNGYDEVNGDHTSNGVNGAHTNGDENDHERPAKRRRTRDPSTPPPGPKSARKLKNESPPWKRFEAEGPTTYSENGRRRSGRTNAIPLELQPPSGKRMTRKAYGANQRSPAGKVQASPATETSRQSNGFQKPMKPAHARTSSTSTPKSGSKKPATESRPPSRSTRRRTPSPSHQPTRQSTRTRRASRSEHDVERSGQGSRYSTRDTGRSPRVKLRVTRSGVVPLVHPDQVRKRPKIGANFEDFWLRAGNIPVEEGGLLASEDGLPYTDESARRDALVINRIESEVEPGGLLSQERCSLFLPDAEEEPPRQWARQDHMMRAMANFRKLMLAEQQRHRSTAKKVAEACREEWLRRQPKSAEQVEAEAREYWVARYRQVVRVLFGTWENVRVEVNRRRLEEWEAEEQRRVKAALNEAVSLSEQKLQARQAGLDSEMPSDEDGFSDLSDELQSEEGDGQSGSDGAEGEADDEDSDVMSSSDDDDEEEVVGEGGDEGLTQEQLQAKYANIPALEKTEGDETDTSKALPLPNGDSEMGQTIGETSDESVDMDDDMGSTDMDDDEEDEEYESGKDEEESEEEEEDDSGDDAGGLLGMLFGKSELKEMKTKTEGEVAKQEDAEMEDATPAATVEQATPAGGSTETPAEPAIRDEGKGEVEDDVENEMSLVQGPESTNGESRDVQADTPSIAETKGSPLAEPDRPEATEKTDVDQMDTEAVKTIVNDKAATIEPTAEPIDIKTDIPDPAAEPIDIKSDTPGPAADTKPSDVIEEVEEVVDEHMTDVAETRSKSVSSQPRSEHKTEVPFLLRGTLREYQHHGLDWLAGLYANNTNGILADEMGLGKTIQTIALLAHLACHHEVWGPHLVIVPTSVMLNWEMEFKKWCPGFKILAYYGTQEERKRKRQGWNNDDVWNVCITSYQLVLQDQQVFKRRRWHYMILDEAHNIKNFKSQRWQTLLGFNTQARLLLTGTPLQNNLTELWSLLFFLMPAENGVGGFADLQEFQDWFHRPEAQILESGREQMDEEAKAIISKLHKVLRPYLLRRLKADVEKQMPGKYEHVEFCRLSKRQRELYDGFLARADTKNTLASGNYMSIINCLMQLRKVCNHPDLFVDRPIMTSFRMQKSVVAEYAFTDQAMHRSILAEKPMSEVSLSFLNMIPTQYEGQSSSTAERIFQLSSNRTLMEMREAQRIRAQSAITSLDPATVASNIAYIESASRWGRYEELQHCVYLNALRRQQKPIYGKNVIDMLTIGVDERPSQPRPKVPKKIMAWFEEDSNLIRSLVQGLDQRADSLKTTIEKFLCVTPAVITRDLDQHVLGLKGMNAFTDEDLKLSAPVHWTPWMPKEPPLDPWHEARMRSSIQFPDRRLLQYDCGKLQVLDKLLRKLQAGGHRALIFTQMTKVLDILEQFLNIHGHKYLRLDGATKVEQRQILTDRFNHDPRILCFILSTRSGGLGINLTGADTVIFYDQDWNPAMDKQCQDRCHRIGQTRDVHIYRLVSEHTIEANILRKASQKQMLDDVVIQEGEFTTDTFNKQSVRDVLTEKVDFTSEGVSAADAALDRVLGGGTGTGAGEGALGSNQRTVGRVLEQAEDKEDVTAARAAEKEILADDADFTERPSNVASGASTTRQGTPAGGKSVLDGGLDEPDVLAEELEAEYNAWGARLGNIDDFMLAFMREALRDTKLDIPKDKKKGKKKGKDTRKR